MMSVPIGKVKYEFKIKMVEPVFMTNRKHRLKAIKEAGYNTFLLKTNIYTNIYHLLAKSL
ncbi:MAG TPA: hypothetical protein EYP80_00505 [Candidatus Aenigmarchaeota archaeon]|nr:hypothetical protein [Candidatus Aenigmarchaeota archaeon]